MRNHVFISYSHKDQEWLERLKTALSPLIRQGTIRLWDDSQILPGQQWRTEISEALAEAKVGILLVSPDFLASDFIAGNELPQLLAAAEQSGLVIFWIPIRHSFYTETPIRDYQAAASPNRPLASLSDAEVDEVLVKIARKIKTIVSPHSSEDRAAPDSLEPASSQPASSQPVESGPFPQQPVSAGGWNHHPLDEILPGQWQISIQGAFPGAQGTMNLDMAPSGTFRGQLMTPIGPSMVEGQWKSDSVSPQPQVSLQGMQGNGFQLIPYVVVVTFNFVSAQKLFGLTSGGEQVVWQKWIR